MKKNLKNYALNMAELNVLNQTLLQKSAHRYWENVDFLSFLMSNKYRRKM